MELAFEHPFADALEGLYIPWQPQGFPAPELMLLNRALARDLGLPELSPAEAAAVLSGTTVPEDARPVAQAYAGHQFGGFSPQLGDGRALLLGELVDGQGRRFDVHLKGSGRTPFSRGGDGKAAVGPVLREYVISEAMHRLGVPTTRVLAAIRTGETIRREGPLPGAVLARVAASHLRVGTLQFLAVRDDVEGLERAVRYALARHYPDRADAENPALALLHGVAEAQARLIARWMLVGFIHGVMNTDNSTLSGETIDYGPCAFMDAYDPATVFSSIDHHGRYAFGNQPGIGQWNLARLSEALLPLLAPAQEEAVEHAQGALARYREAFHGHLLDGMRAKLGLTDEAEGDAELVSDLFDWMKATAQDYTLTFRELARGLRAGEPAFTDGAFLPWHGRWRARHADEPAELVAARMDAINPLYIPRNHLVEAALDAAVDGNMGPLHTLLEVLASPFEPQAGREAYAEPAPPEFGPYKTFCGT